MAGHVLVWRDLEYRPEVLLGLAGVACEHNPVRAVLDSYVGAGHHGAETDPFTTGEDAKGSAFYIACAQLAVEDMVKCMAVERLKVAWLLAMG